MERASRPQPNVSKGPATRSEPAMETMRSRAIHVVGSCRCGGIQLEITAAPLLTMACHCVGCQKMTASAFSLSAARSEEHTSELQSLMRISYAVFCLKKKKKTIQQT